MEEILRVNNTSEEMKSEDSNAPPLDKSIGSRFTLLGVEKARGAKENPRKYDWKTYFDMYEKHPTVNAAIQKIVKVAVNTGFEFVPRSAAMGMSQKEIDEARIFFEALDGFKDELTWVYLHLMIFGDAYMYIVPKRNRKPSRLKALLPWTISIKANKHGEVIEYYQEDPDNPTGSPIRYKPYEILHFRRHNPQDKLFGLSPLESLKSVVLTDVLAEQFNRQFFKNGASTGTVFIFNGADESSVARMRKWIHEKFVGSENAHLPLVIDGDVKVEHTTPAMQDMGFENGRASIRAQILAVLDVPPAKLGYMETANRSNSKEQDKTFRTESILPLQNLVETVISDHLIRDILGLPNVLFNHSDADVRDRQEQMDLWKTAIQNGVMNINEVRKLMGMNPTDGGDINYIMSPTGAVPVVDMELYFRLAQANTDKIPESMHNTHKHPRGENGSLVGPEPKNSKGELSILETPATKSTTLYAMGFLLEKAKHNEKSLRQLWAYAHDYDENSGLTETLTKAVKADDDLLRLTYVERAEEMVDQLLKGVSDD